MSDVKDRCWTQVGPVIVLNEHEVEGKGLPGVSVKYVDIRRNVRGVSALLGRY